MVAGVGGMEARRPFRDFRLVQLRLNGETVNVSLSGAPRFDETGSFVGYRGTGANITERVEAEKALRRSEEGRAVLTVFGDITQVERIKAQSRHSP